MKILFASKREFFPDWLDGAVQSAHTLLHVLTIRGHTCEAVSGGKIKKILLHRLLPYASEYKIYRTPVIFFLQTLKKRLDNFKPDVVFTQLEGSQDVINETISRGIPTILYITDAEFDLFFKKDFPKNRLLLCLSMSRFIARAFEERYHIQTPVLYPPILFEWYLCNEPSKKEYITLINPVAQKGIHMVLECAKRLQHRKFALIETWPLSREERRALLKELQLLPNVILLSQKTSLDKIYESTSLLMMPSRWQEAFGRVILEAQANGIPVLASKVGGIPEVLNKGGELISSHADASVWSNSIERILTDQTAYDRLSKDAYQNAKRPEFQAERIVDNFITLAHKHVQLS